VKESWTCVVSDTHRTGQARTVSLCAVAACTVRVPLQIPAAATRGIQATAVTLVRHVACRGTVEICTCKETEDMTWSRPVQDSGPVAATC
jgi:hypothetical protein